MDGALNLQVKIPPCKDNSNDNSDQKFIVTMDALQLYQLNEEIRK
jgi:hypothetical protein